MHQRNQVEDLELYITPPVDKFSLLDLNNYDKIVAAGYAYGKEYLKTAELKKVM